MRPGRRTGEIAAACQASPLHPGRLRADIPQPRLIPNPPAAARPTASRPDADLALFAYIDGWYNTRRIQKRLDWLSPDEYEAKHYTDQATTEPVTIQPSTPILTR
ncbi:IS3 family transposase [Kitasatospora sp. NPDC059800]|uniref:IS3 family transposase n=1 Tax=Kitasatospora sp. NPDC059800 TaxID=3346951 RepID=UPI00099FDA64